ncbi:unnamed protein product [Fusarium graminearum]|uniref:Chromosome 3, complete genome n=1 Tax=Gibberella zeae (strain ATCC MYA-4620 / CBS 123657 / FGSC 9075 / NRRL 31084 / PH-1) TaxID=229533 RepID=A0A098E0A2_GIBZE|nr:unnamed protein product [Fusarium graminearum]
MSRLQCVYPEFISSLGSSADVIIPMVQLYASTTTCLIIMSLRWRKGAHAKPCTSQLTSTSVKLGSG